MDKGVRTLSTSLLLLGPAICRVLLPPEKVNMNLTLWELGAEMWSQRLSSYDFGIQQATTSLDTNSITTSF